MSQMIGKIQAAADYLKERIAVSPKVGVVLGSGWGGMIEDVVDPVRVAYAEVPHMMHSTVPGHAGEWIFGQVGGQPVAIMSGRLHHYEGYALGDVTFPIRIMKALGIETVILTNAAGAVNTAFEAGDLMLITDHINLTGENPLIGPNEATLGARFVDMTQAYDRALLEIARRTAAQLGFAVREGVYTWMTGPTFETPAEIRMVRTMGGDAVGMSTVPEAIVARHAGMRVLAASCLTNMAAGVLDQPLSHQEVLETAERVKARFRAYLTALVSAI